MSDEEPEWDKVFWQFESEFIEMARDCRNWALEWRRWEKIKSKEDKK